eukprot:5470578-Prymnesium_polylepis.1
MSEFSGAGTRRGSSNARAQLTHPAAAAAPVAATLRPACARLLPLQRTRTRATLARQTTRPSATPPRLSRSCATLCGIRWRRAVRQASSTSSGNGVSRRPWRRGNRVGTQAAAEGPVPNSRRAVAHCACFF